MGLPEFIILGFFFVLVLVAMVVVFKFLSAAVHAGTSRALKERDRKP